MFTTTSTYNGWSNRETWLASLWLTNDEGNADVLNQARCKGNEDCDHAEWLELQLREQLYSSIEAGLFGDLLHTAFERINWVEVVEKC